LIRYDPDLCNWDLLLTEAYRRWPEARMMLAIAEPDKRITVGNKVAKVMDEVFLTNRLN
jgi:hypothetical protein